MGFLDRFKKQKEQEVEGGKVMERPETSSATADVPVQSSGKDARRRVAKHPTASASVTPVTDRKSQALVPSGLADVLLRPVVTEKAAAQSSLGQYAFVVQNHATRVQVRQAIKAVYGVTPMSVRMQNMRREPVRFGRIRGMQKAWKKAIVSVPKGQTLKIHEGV
ncbi:50S ribosomal protein L23 [Candidatus Uhrbacteria bacterium]|nr:50S ribosomal protein L23 [Candidatus Uhrbacteria bacterium]